jgi:hypothetical protein
MTDIHASTAISRTRPTSAISSSLSALSRHHITTLDASTMLANPPTINSPADLNSYLPFDGARVEGSGGKAYELFVRVRGLKGISSADEWLYGETFPNLNLAWACQNCMRRERPYIDTKIVKVAA